jgi:hypothetical protein
MTMARPHLLLALALAVSASCVGEDRDRDVNGVKGPGEGGADETGGDHGNTDPDPGGDHGTDSGSDEEDADPDGDSGDGGVSTEGTDGGPGDGGSEDQDPSGGSGGTGGIQTWDGIEVYVIPARDDPAGPSPLILALPDLGANVTKNADIIGTPQVIQGHQTTACTSCVTIGVQSIEGMGSWDYESNQLDHDRLRTVILKAFDLFNIDMNRVMLFGLSRGGTQAFLMLDSGDLVTHISQAGGGGMYFQAMGPQTGRIKLYFQAGEYDNGVPIVTNKAQELLTAGYEVYLKIWPGKGHGYGISENETILDWFLHDVPPGNEPNCCIELP